MTNEELFFHSVFSWFSVFRRGRGVSFASRQRRFSHRHRHRRTPRHRDSRASNPGDLAYDSYIGKYELVGLRQDRKFKTSVINHIPREYDTEAKFLEFVASKKKPTDAFEVTILSERHICQSCQGVVEQFEKMFPNAKVNIVSGKLGYNGDELGGKTWKYRKRVKNNA